MSLHWERNEWNESDAANLILKQKGRKTLSICRHQWAGKIKSIVRACDRTSQAREVDLCERVVTPPDLRQLFMEVLPEPLFLLPRPRFGPQTPLIPKRE